ncbi:phosphoinositide 3-kinase regulatory subunit 6 [Chanos chanos]|uniref:Phosphoinositide 3-kinase regulatory subunit 6 n=1 Tax=Chanos chanos TaxID=29144 RepID=A0A6J2X042_CHACN|nr:phosphoinositide 3-kinase regulatory subunit 6-like [Chanos chanos]
MASAKYHNLPREEELQWVELKLLNFHHDYMKLLVISIVQTMLRELDSESPARLACNKGMLRWMLHKSLQKNPANSISLVSVLIKELEKAERIDSKQRVIPLLHTLAYAIIQAVHVPDDLLDRVCSSLKRLLTLPEPYCTVALNYIRCMKMERSTPGALYQRRVIAEHSLKNDHYPLQEKVMVFADPAVFSPSLMAAVGTDVKCHGSDRDTLTYERSILLHTLQSVLGRHCNGCTLAQALEVCVELKQYFQESVAAAEQNCESTGSEHGQYSRKIKQIYHSILRAANQDSTFFGPLVEAPLPSPDISFHAWTKDEEIWSEVVNFILSDEAELIKRVSTTSTDSGIEGDLPMSEFSNLTVEPPAVQEVQEQRRFQQFSRVPCLRPNAKDRTTLVREGYNTRSRLNPSPKDNRNYIARIVVMGDDRTLGRLGKAYLCIRKNQAQNMFLTRRVKLELYYIPVTNQSGATSPVQEESPQDLLTMSKFLGFLDPWYDCNINGLGAVVLQLAQMPTNHKSSSQDSFLLDTISYYIRTGQQPVHIPVYTVKIAYASLTASPVEELFVSHLEIDFPELSALKAVVKASGRGRRQSQEVGGAVISVHYRRTSLSGRDVDKGVSLMTCGVQMNAVPVNGEKGFDCLTVNFSNIFTNPSKACTSILRTTSISIRTLEARTFTVCLDKDSRRTFQKMNQKSTQCFHEEKANGISRYLNKALSLPINTFSGSIL